jgi:hypothetical protein
MSAAGLIPSRTRRPGLTPPADPAARTLTLARGPPTPAAGRTQPTAGRRRRVDVLPAAFSATAAT